MRSIGFICFNKFCFHAEKISRTFHLLQLLNGTDVLENSLEIINRTKDGNTHTQGPVQKRHLDLDNKESQSLDNW